VTRQYVYPPTIAAYTLCQKRLQFLFGPLGGGKTTGTLMKLLTLAHQQRANPNGVRKTRWAVVRNTRPQLRDSVLKTVFEWLPPNGKTIKWNETNMDLLLDMPLPDGTRVHCEMMFRALDDEKDARRLLSVEFTGGWLSEFREIPFTLLTDLLSRCGRYPSMSEGGADWYGVMGESNMCTKGSDWYDFLMVKRPDNCAVYIQPSALSDQAENTKYLKPDYYTMLLAGKPKNWIQAHVTCEFPDSLDGRAVWGSSYDYERHVAKEILVPFGQSPIIIGVDQGRSPAAVAVQMGSAGQVRVLRSTYASGMGMDRFAAEYLRPMCAEHFPGMPILCVIDPAGVRKSEVNDVSPKDVLESSGFRVIPAPTNDLDRRINAVERQLVLHQGMIFSPAVPELISAVAADYRFRTKKNGDLEDVPEKKHPISDLSDALQYASLVASGDVYGRVLKLAARGRGGAVAAPPPPSRRAWT
jgi:hypothetical protein